jgi:hypothetical protein
MVYALPASGTTRTISQPVFWGSSCPPPCASPARTCVVYTVQVAVAEARTMVEQGYRVAFFAPTQGELERLADILREYSVPFQLGLAPGPVASIYLIKGLVRRGVVFSESSKSFYVSRS